MLGDEGAGRLIKIIENNKVHSAKKIYKSNKYEEDKKLLSQYFPHNDKNNN